MHACSAFIQILVMKLILIFSLVIDIKRFHLPHSSLMGPHRER